jgi:hypothetical protein
VQNTDDVTGDAASPSFADKTWASVAATLGIFLLPCAYWALETYGPSSRVVFLDYLPLRDALNYSLVTALGAWLGARGFRFFRFGMSYSSVRLAVGCLFGGVLADPFDALERLRRPISGTHHRDRGLSTTLSWLVSHFDPFVYGDPHLGPLPDHLRSNRFVIGRRGGKSFVLAGEYGVAPLRFAFVAPDLLSNDPGFAIAPLSAFSLSRMPLSICAAATIARQFCVARSAYGNHCTIGCQGGGWSP